LLEFVEMFKAPIKVLHPLLTATQEGNYKGTEPKSRDERRRGAPVRAFQSTARRWR
jgi:predicted Ser/Thr protein kinase